MSYEHILYQVEGAVATLTLNRPERLNAITPLMREEIYQAIAESEESNDVRAVIITGAGKGFCSGGDVKAMQENIKNRQGNPLEERITPMRDKVVLAMRETSKPLIAAINGAAAGGGLGLALSCDIRLASNNARMGMTFSRRGLHPDWGGTYFLPRLVGTAKAAELIWSGRMIEADEALHLLCDRAGRTDGTGPEHGSAVRRQCSCGDPPDQTLHLRKYGQRPARGPGAGIISTGHRRFYQGLSRRRRCFRRETQAPLHRRINPGSLTRNITAPDRPCQWASAGGHR